MTIAFDDTKRLAIAMELAQMKALQNLLISNEQILLNAINDDNIRQRLEEMLKRDRQNLGILETVIIEYGVKSESQDFEQKLEDIHNQMEGSELTVFEKVFQHELLKHQQTMKGLTIHKAAQVVGTDVEAAIAPLHTINFENRAHQEQLKGILEVLGVRELTGVEPDRGLWARVEDAIAALTGVAGSVVTRTDDEMSICDLLLMDHSKADILFAEILGSDDPIKIQEYFGQLYRDVGIHGLAEEQVVYPAFRPYYQHTQQIVEQTDEAIAMLEEVRTCAPTAPDFKTQVKRLRLAVREHIDREENETFPILRNNFSHEQQKHLASEFKAAKSKLQEQSDFSVLEQQANQRRMNSRNRDGLSSTINTIFWKRIFQVKAVINWVEAILLLFADRIIRDGLQTEPLVNLEYSQLFYGLVIIIGIGYWWVGRDISQNHDIVRLGILAQGSVFTVLAYHTLFGSLHPFYLISGFLDLTFAILFIGFLSSYSQVEKVEGTP